MKRYSHFNMPSVGGSFGAMEESEDGEWVKFEDTQADIERQLKAVLDYAQQERAEILGLLKEVEWNGYSQEGGNVCPCCEWFQSEGHKDGCKLAAMIRRLKGEEK